MTTIAAIDVGYGYIKAISASFSDGKAREKLAFFPATTQSVLGPSAKVKMAGANVDVPNVVSFDHGKKRQRVSFRVGDLSDPHVLSPESRGEFPPPVMAMLIYALHCVAACESPLVVIGVPVGFKMKNQVAPPRWPVQYALNNRVYKLSVGETIVTGQTVGTIVCHNILNGIVVDVGYGTTDIVAVREGKIRTAISIEKGISDAVALAAQSGEENPQEAVKSNRQYVLTLCDAINEQLTLVKRQVWGGGTTDKNQMVFLTGGGGSLVFESNAITGAQLVGDSLWANARGLLKVALKVAKKKSLVS